MIRKPVVAILAALAVSCFAMPAAAETFTSQDGVVSIELPGENWKQIEDVTKWITLSDGANQICSTAGNAVSGLKQVMNSTTITARDDKQGL